LPQDNGFKIAIATGNKDLNRVKAMLQVRLAFCFDWQGAGVCATSAGQHWGRELYCLFIGS
jgi:hypothetical protein